MKPGPSALLFPRRLRSLLLIERRQLSAPQVGMAMGLIFAVVGFTTHNFGIVGLGVVVALVGYFAPSADE